MSWQDTEQMLVRAKSDGRGLMGTDEVIEEENSSVKQSGIPFQIEENASKEKKSLPGRLVQKYFETGGINASVFSLIQITFGAGILTFPYAVMENGIVLGSFLIILGGVVSWYTGMLLIEASSRTGRVRYEDIAKCLYGKHFAVATAVMNVMALVSFNMSYVVYVSIGFHNKMIKASNKHA